MGDENQSWYLCLYLGEFSCLNQQRGVAQVRWSGLSRAAWNWKATCHGPRASSAGSWWPKILFCFLIDLSLTPSCLPGRSSLWALTLSPHTCGDCHHLLLTCRSSLWLFDGVAQSVMSVCRQVGRENPKRRTHGGGSNSKHTALLLVWNWTGKTLTKLGEQNN